MIFDGVVNLLSPNNIWSKVKKDKDGNERAFPLVILMFIGTVACVGAIGGALVLCQTVMRSFGYFFSGLFLLLPGGENPRDRGHVCEIFKTAWPITAGLMWISLTCIIPGLISEFSTVFTSAMCTMGLAAFIYAISNGKWGELFS